MAKTASPSSSWSMWIAVAAALCALSLRYLSRENLVRDAQFYQPLPNLSLPPTMRSGSVTVRHSKATLLQVADAQGPSPDEPVDMAYHTSYAPDNPECSPKKHVLLIHGTGFNKDTFFWTKDTLQKTGHEGVASVLSPQLLVQSIVDRLHASEPGICVTAIDLRGHGNSSVTAGPWSVRLLAADVAEALQLIHGQEVKVHAYGHSVGFGIVLDIAFHYPQLLWSASGGGFLPDMSANNGWLAWIFSRAPVVNALGMELNGAVGGGSISLSTPAAFITELFRFVQLRGHLYTAQSWLHYNQIDQVSTMKVPVLWLHPIRDDLCDFTMEKVQRQFNQLPTANGNKLIVYNVSGDEDHCYNYLDPDKYFGDVIDFVKSKL